MTDPKAEQSLKNLGRALDRLREAVDAPEDSSLKIDASIQRFEFVIELFWKTYKRFLGLEGIVTSTPRDSIQKAFQIGWIDDESAWLEMLRDRNETSHLYDEAVARRIYQNIKSNLPTLEKARKFLAERSIK